MNVHGLQIADTLYRFITDEVLPGTGLNSDYFWRCFEAEQTEV